MARISLCTVIILIAFQLLSCGERGQSDEPCVAAINEFKLSIDEFNSKLANELEMDDEFKLTRSARKQFLESIIKKELLIQEARKLDLDKEDAFIKSIEQYWEATLIRDLMEKKGKEISKKIIVSQEEIKERYDAMINAGQTLPSLHEMEGEIRKEIKEAKKTKELMEWIDSLLEKASIKINDQLLYQN